MEPLPSSSHVPLVSGSYSSALLSGLSSERQIWLVLASFFGHSFAMCPLLPLEKQAPSALRRSISAILCLLGLV